MDIKSMMAKLGTDWIRLAWGEYKCRTVVSTVREYLSDWRSGLHGVAA
jgi:hypothetical protein